MRELSAKLPMLGETTIQLFNESEKVYNLFQKNIEGQKNILHLGMAAIAHTGITHTRYEYLLLQLSVIKLFSKLFKEHAELAIAAPVKLPKITNPISSGEELLKIWVLLNSIGHMKYTFGTERVLLKKCAADESFKEALIHSLPLGIRRYANGIIRNYNYERFYKLLSLFHINQIEDARSRNLFYKIYRIILLPVDELGVQDSRLKEKIIRLTKLYDLTRILSQLSIDTFYSHSSINLDLAGVIMSLDKLVLSRRHYNTYMATLRTIGAEIACETYLHKSTTAVIGRYEQHKLKKLDARPWKNNLPQVIEDLRSSGLGVPRSNDWGNIFRITLSRNKISNHKIFSTCQKLNSILDKESTFYATLINNDYSSHQYLDIAAQLDVLSLRKALEVLGILYRWFLERAEIGARFEIRKFKRQIPQELWEGLGNLFETKRKDTIQSLVDEFVKHGRDIVKSILRLLVRKEYSFALPCPDILKSTGVALFDSQGQSFSNIPQIFEQHKMFYGDSPDKLRELEAINNELNILSKSQLLICSFANVRITDVIGRGKDEWDGFIISLNKDKMNIRILECKNRQRSNEGLAFKQMKETRKFLNSKYISRSRREIIDGFGARLIIN